MAPNTLKSKEDKTVTLNSTCPLLRSSPALLSPSFHTSVYGGVEGLFLALSLHFGYSLNQFLLKLLLK